MRTKKVIVGYDGSDSARIALEWAGDVAQRRKVPLLIVNAIGGENSGLGLRRERVVQARRRRAEEVLAQAQEIIEQRVHVPVETTVANDGAAEGLIELSSDAGLLVVGHRGMGTVRNLVLGSVAWAVISHSKSPVAIVRDTNRALPKAGHRITVGVDGSSGSYQALEYAASLAIDTGAPLQIAVAWRELAGELSDTVYQTDDQGNPLPGERDPWSTSSRRSVLDDLSHSIITAAEETAAAAERHLQETHPELTEVSVHVEQGVPQEVILNAAEGAALVVIGARGHSKFSGLLLGSVARNVVHDATCPVMVVR